MKTWIKLGFFGLLRSACSIGEATLTEETQQEEPKQSSHIIGYEASTEETQLEQPSGGLSFDILRFETEGELKEFISVNIDLDLLDVAQRMYDGEGYLSLLLIYSMNHNELDDIGLDTDSIPLVNSYDDMLHLLLNRNAEIEIAGYTMRIDENFVFTYKNGSSHVSEFLVDYSEGRVEIEKGQTVDYNVHLTVFRHDNDESIAEDIAEDVDKRRITMYDYFTGDVYRMQSKQWNGYWSFYTSIGSSTKVQLKTRYWWWGWQYRWKTVTRYNRLKYNLMYTMQYNGYTVKTLSADGHEYCHCDSAKAVYNWMVGIPTTPISFTPVDGSGESIHWAHEFSTVPCTEHRTIYY